MIDIIHIRTSTEEQNPQNQLKDCKSIAPKDFKLFEEKQSVWKDNPKGRPIFKEILSLIKAGKVTSYTVWDLDRIYRKRVLTAGFFQLCKQYDVIVRSYRQQWLNDIEKIPVPWNEIVHNQLIHIFGWMAEEESNKKSDRVKIAYKNHKGEKWGRPELSPMVIDVVLKLKSEGNSIRKIAGLVTYWDKNNNKKNISKSAVHKIIAENSPKNASFSAMSQKGTIKGQSKKD